MGNACSQNMSIIPECITGYVGAQVLPGLQPMEVASACALEAAGFSQFEVSSLGSKGERWNITQRHGRSQEVFSGKDTFFLINCK